MPIETRSNSALFRRAEQLKRWEESETNIVSPTIPKGKISKIKFSDGCVFLAACAASDTEEVERLLEIGTDINTANVDGLTALHQACIDNNLEMVQFLVEHECDVNRGDNEGWTPLHATASCGFISIAKYLIENGANVAAVNNDGDLPIDIAESTEMEEYLSDVLDEQGIDCDDARSEEERIMLEDAKQMLTANKVQDKIHPRTGASSLHVAAAKGYTKVMNILIQLGSDLNAQDNDGWTPLHAAAHWGQKEACAVLTDNLANMDIQNLARQTCFDVAEPDLIKLLEELKKKQATMQKDRPEIQAILQRTSNRPPLKRRTSVTRMSNQEKSKSVMKDTKAERAQIENLTLPEEETEEEKELQSKKAVEADLKSPREISKEQEVEVKKVPLWKEVLRRSSEILENPNTDVSEVTLKRPRKSDETSEKNGPAGNTSGKDGKPFVSPVRDEESESQRKAHAKRVRETRRSTQGVLLEDIRSAELQFLINTQKEAAKRQAEEAECHPDPFGIEDNGKNKTLRESSQVYESLPRSKRQDSYEFGDDQDSEIGKYKVPGKSEAVSKPIDSQIGNDSPSVTLSLRTKASSSLEDNSLSENRALGTQAAIQRRKKPKRRSTGVVYLDSEAGQEEKEKNDEPKSEVESASTERPKHRYGSSSSLTDATSEASSRSETRSRNCSRSSLIEDNRDYKRLYENAQEENERLKETLKKTEEELERTKKQLQKLSQNNLTKISITDAEKKERRALERKLSEMEEELKNISKLKTENEKLKAENRALSRVVCKLTK